MNKINYAAHNWLALKINNYSFRKWRDRFTGRVIDLGCGKAQYKNDILATANEYIGVDWENSMHDQLNVDVFADLNQVLLFDESFADTILSFQVMEHLREPDLFLSECFRILKNGGCIFISVPFMWQVHEPPYDFYRYTRYGLEYLFSKNGFTDITIEETSGFWQTMVLKFNYHTLRMAVGPLRLFWIPLWWIGQVVAPVLDKIDRHPEETASYTVFARKADVA